ncbi:RTA1-domain-containing protein [Xylariomycetidae sp. FL2044]|nr:RTA1-domain-containing protein [Xylariomycetidae sp. FL2044]
MGSQQVDPDAFFALYRYLPSLEAAAISVACFALVTAGHVFRMFRARTFYFTPFVIGGAFETVGYIGRIWSHYDLASLGGFIMQSLLILLAPALYAASIYMILGRMIRALEAEHHSLIPVRFLTKVFVVGDVISFLLQSLGGGIQAAGSLELFHMGEKIIVAGLFIQILFFGFFMVTAIIFYTRLNAKPTNKAAKNTIPWKRYLTTLYLASAIIMIRSVFRVVEYIQGNDGFIIRREYLLYIFDALLMFLVMVSFLVCYVGNLEAPTHVKLAEDEESVELTNTGYNQ